MIAPMIFVSFSIEVKPFLVVYYVTLIAITKVLKNLKRPTDDGDGDAPRIIHMLFNGAREANTINDN
jgi:hypothetical protein